MDQARRRSSMKTTEALRHLGVSRSSYFRWKKEEPWRKEESAVVKPVQAFEDLPEPELMRSIRLFGETVIPALRGYEPF